MKLAGESWRFGWTTCPGCGSFVVRISLLCAHCEDRLLAKARAGVAIHSGWTHRFLFDWVPGEDARLSNLIVGLKGPGAADAWGFWAERFLQTHLDSLPPLSSLAVCAAPSRQAVDHASHFATHLALRIGRPYCDRPLRKRYGVSLRSLSRAARAEENGFVKSSDSVVPRDGRIVMMDDVVTTGTTARAVRQALRFPPGFEVWTLAWRTRPSCGASSLMVGI